MKKYAAMSALVMVLYMHAGVPPYPLHQAIKDKNEKLVKLLLSMGADSNALADSKTLNKRASANSQKASPIYYYTPLLSAVCNENNKAIVQRLLDNQAVPDLPDIFGYT